jgi:hypothetical protein
MALALVLLVAGALLPRSDVFATTPEFDHFTTGFELIGAHASVECSQCHVDGALKGTPTACQACHTAGARTGSTAKPTNHILSSDDCSQCHTPFAWRPVARFNHINVLGTCSSCHNSVQAVGKGPSHLPTTLECNVCHVVNQSWTTAAFDHAGITGNCASCHDNVHAPGKPADHVPSSLPCETCHSPTNFKTFGGTSMNHVGITSDCQTCHETGMNWYGVVMVDRPTLAQDPIHPTATSPDGLDCSNCHQGFGVGDFAKNIWPSNHIPTSSTAQCKNCHVTSDLSAFPSVAADHLYAPSTTNNCTQCHGANAARFAIPRLNFSITGMPINHIPTSQSCEVCHVAPGSSIASTPVVDGARFSNSAMNHAGVTSCAACHGPGVGAFAGITSIVLMPPTSPSGSSSHIPSATACETCHQGAMPSGLVPANATTLPPGSRFATPVPSTQQVHAGVTGSCNSCHEGGSAWMGMDKYPLVPAALTGNPTTQYQGFNTRPGRAAGTFTLLDSAHPTIGDCGDCHSGVNYFEGLLKPSNHIPTATSAQCSNCHTSTDFSVIPTITAIHQYAPSTSGNCAQCHGSTADSFAIPSANFSIVGQPSNHLPTTQPCEVCHVGAGSSIAATPVKDGAKFSGSAMSHRGVTSCDSCHGPNVTSSSFAGITSIIVMPPTSPAGPTSHLPTGTACETCHQASVPTGLVSGNATTTVPGSLFGSPAPSTAQIHSGVTGSCNACHEAGLDWVGMTRYPISPTALTGTATTQYVGFNVRPGRTAGTYTLLDPAHPSGGDCGQCHGNTNYFEGMLKPSNHIPTATTAQCTNCHVGTDFSVMPSLTAIHQYAPSTTTNCTQCHGSAAASFAIPAANFTVTGLPTDHLPTSQSCETCHVGSGSSIAVLPVTDGAKFSNSLMSHKGVTTCVECHGPNATSFNGITRIIVMPPTSPAGPGAHIPTSTACESCHQASMPATAIAANATTSTPGSLFATPVPSTTQIHAGISSGCGACHESSLQWMGMDKYPISPTTFLAGSQYTGFQLRPGATPGAFVVQDAAHATTGDCVTCHGTNVNYFDSAIKPGNHIPTAATATCANCHVGADFSVMPPISKIHQFAPNSTSNCVQCHGTSQAAGFAIPAINFRITTMSALASGGAVSHLPTSQSCETCHVGAGSSVASIVLDGSTFAGSRMNHAGATTCAECHGPGGATSSYTGISSIVVMPATTPAGAPTSHIPSSTSCEACHQSSVPSGLIGASATATPPGTLFGTPVPSTSQIHGGVTTNCNACHEAPYAWMGMDKYPISPTALTGTATTQYVGFQTRPGKTSGTYILVDPAHPTGGDCGQCHGNTNYFEGMLEPSNHIPTASTAQCTNCHVGTDFSVMPSLTAIHQYAPSTSTNCAQCHGSAAASFAIPAANFSIVGLPSNHLPTSLSCEACHVGSGSSIAATPVKDGAKFTGSTMSHQGLTTCAECHGPNVTTFAGVNKIVVMPPSSPAGASAHVPSGTACETCHQASMPSTAVPANATLTAPGTLFATPAPTSSQIHAGITTGCAACHEGGMVWMGMSKYPLSPSALTGTATTQYHGFNTRPGKTGGTFTLADPAHPTSGDCASCHTGTDYFEGLLKPSNHIPTATTATCTNCHTGTDFSVMPTLAAIHQYAPSTTTNCAQCHGSAAASFAIPAVNFTIVGLPSNHVPTSQSCEVCHVGASSSIASTPVPNGAKFSGSRMSHATLTTCVECHGPTVTGFAGITKIIVMPPTSPAGSAAHIPSTTACESCHQGSMPSGLVAANATTTVPGSLFATPVPTTAQIHAGVANGCPTCHESGMNWLDMAKYPLSPSALTGTATTQYLGFNTRPGKTAGTFTLRDPAHPTSGDCVLCHSGTDYFEGLLKPANHIPASSKAVCTNCHVGTDFSVMPTLTAIHQYAPSTTTNCAQCHGSAAATFAIPEANFSIVGLPSTHLPTSQSCEVCHVGAGSSISATPVKDGAKFTNSLMSHKGVTTCVECHGSAVTGFFGITRVVLMPPTSPAGASAHIPSSTACESCHQGSVPSALVPANATLTAPGTLFATPVPSTAQIHAGVTSGCTTCHEGGTTWMGMSKYPLSPTALTGNATTQYLGFNTRPGKTAGTFTLADPAHPASGDCVLCHGNTNYFEGMLKPGNHIPTATTASCTNCHVGTDFSVMPTLTAIHQYAPSTTTNCAQCHGSAAASFAIPAANFSIVGLPGNHIPTSQSCEVCHVGAGSSIAATPVKDGAKFTNSLMSHKGVTTCGECHGPSVTTFAGITRIIAMPSTSPASLSAHIPSSAACEGCHLGSMPSSPIAANATLAVPGSLFATPVPSTAQIHSGVTGNCTACHESGNVWLGVDKYPISPAALTGTTTTQYVGFNNRPGKTAGTYTLLDPAHPTDGDCGQCHTNTNYFEGVLKPSNHIPTAASSTCTNCHVATDFSVMPSLTAIHQYAPSTTSNCAQCHGSTAASFAIPAANFTIVGLPSNHIPTSQACEACHVGSGSSIAATPVVDGAKFSGSRMNHAGTTTCVECHGPGITSFAGITKIVAMPPTSPAAATSHIPSGTACESCHQGSVPSGLVAANATLTAPGTLFATPVPTTAQIHAGVSSGCPSCHEGGNTWMDMSKYPISPSTLSSTATTQYTGFQTRPGKTSGTFRILDAAHPTTGDCAICHTGTDYFEGLLKPSNHIPTATTATCINCHTGTDFSVMPTLATIHKYAPSTTTNCAQCHGSAAASFALPDANFSIVGLPSNHIPTSQSCEICHVGAGSSVTSTPVPNGAKFSGSKMSHAGVTTCVECHGPTVATGGFAGITRVVVMPQTSPAGTSSHIPSSTACEACHQASTPSGLIAASATLPVPGSLFATPVPSTSQIHAGVTSGCTACHEGGNVWMDMTKYPISPTALTGNATTQYLGFQTRPGRTAGTYTIADAAHPATGDCVACHGNTNYFEGMLKPSNHIPTASTASCTNCHTGTDFSVMPTLTAIHQYAPSTTTNCAQCHGSAAASFAIPAANFTIVGLPSNHIPTSQSCEVCHVGAGSSITATPVVDGAKFTNSLMKHQGVTTCVECHGPNVTTFAGITKIVILPKTSPAGATSHIPSSSACETCHQGTVPSGFVAANAVLTAPGTLFASPAPSTSQIHAGVSSGCAACHEGGNVWMGMTKYPISPTTVTGNSATQYTGFNTRPGPAASTYTLQDAVHPTTGDCGSCHTNTNYFEAAAKPSNHIPTATTASCTNCHTSSDFSVMPTIAAIHQYAPSTTNCTQCHGSAASSFAIPAANFTIVGLPSNHIPTSQSCEVCHVGAGSSVTATPVPNGAKFSGSRMNHAGTTTCAECHGPTITGASFVGITKIIVMPPVTPAGAGTAHIPTGTACETCHAGSAPSGLIAANAALTAPGSLFATPVPSPAQIHSGITSNCQACHESPYAWMSMSKYPISPTTFTSGSQYTGFQTRPGATAGTFIVKDAAHPATGDCASCHGTNTNYFDSALKPSNHIPTATSATCANCHTGTDFAVMPTLTAIHQYAPSTTTNCAQCHGSAASTFAIPAANFTIVGLPTNHIPTTASCEVCHVGAGSSITATPVKTGAKFSGSKMNHSGITTCVACHGPTVSGTTFIGISKIIVMPATTPAGSSLAHIPTSTACESCHLLSMPTGLVAASATVSAPGSLFATPVPTTAQIHAGVTANCTTCHESGYQWMDMSRYPISPATLSSNSATQYTGFQTRPGAFAGTFMILDAQHPTTGDCVTCHGASFSYFSGQAEPANHIPTLAGAACSTCHTTAGNFAVYTTNLTTLHSAVSTTCSTCHADGKGPFAGAPGFTVVQMSTRGVHIPITNAGVAVECSGCHKTVTAFSGTIMSHGAIGDSATSAAGNACDACHEFGYRTKFYGVTINFTRDSSTHYICGAPGTPTAPNVQVCTKGGSDCQTGCHEHYGTGGTRMGNFNTYKAAKRPVSAPPSRAGVPSSAPAPRGTPRSGRIGERDGVLGRAATGGIGAAFNHSDAAPGTCAGCHNGARATGPAATHPPTTKACAACHSRMAWTPVLHVDHAEVLGTCASCHNGTRAAAKPPGHVTSGTDCDRCHTTSAWKPASFDHGGTVPGACETCHNGVRQKGKGPRHPVTTESCDTCHYVLGWSPVKPSVVRPAPRTAPPTVRPTLPRVPGPPTRH